MDRPTEQEVRRRSAGQCEYCRLSERLSKLKFVIDHVIARQHGGSDDMGNLALACGFCNRHKGPNVAGIDPVTQDIIRLFNPRQDLWGNHFIWDGASLVGRTPSGRATIVALAINHATQVAIRQAILDEQELWAPR